MTVLEANCLIAKFMGLLPIPAGTKALGKIKLPEISDALLKYERSWEALMPVVD